MNLLRFTAAALATATLAACGGGGDPAPLAFDDPANGLNDEQVVAQATERLSANDAKAGSCITSLRIGFSLCRVAADRGGELAVGSAARLSIPAGALSTDALVLLREVRFPLPPAGLNQSPQSDAYATTFIALGRNRPLTINADLTLALAARNAPAHPQLGEISRTSFRGWERLQANFFNPATRTVLSLTRQTNETYRVMFRRLQTASGPAVARGFDVFMYETFGNADFFGGALGLHTVLNEVDPVTAVGLGAQVDLAKVPAPIVAAMLDNSPAGLDAKMAALSSPATTRALIKAGAVVGVVGVYADPASDRMTSVGITCALCHQNVTPTTFTLKGADGQPVQAALPIGPLSVDGVPNAKMDAGKILSFTPGAQALGVSSVLAGWGPNRFDIRALNAFDDKADNPTDTPPIWNFKDLEQQGYPLGWDGLFVGENALASQAEAVYHIVMGGKGAFGTANGALPPALNPKVPVRPEVLSALAGAASPADKILITKDKLLDLQEWMRSIASPAPGAFDVAKAEAGWRLFNGKGACSSCHTTPELSGTKDGPFIPNITVQPATGDLAHGIRVPSLRGVSKSAPYFHDDSAADLAAAVDRVTTVVNAVTGATFSADEKAQLVEYLKSL